MLHPPPPLSVELIRTDDIAVAMCSGELDSISAPELELLLTGALDHGVRDIVVNLRDVTFMDSAGLTALFRAAESARWRFGHLFVTRPSDAARRLIELTDSRHQLRMISAPGPGEAAVALRRADEDLPCVQRVEVAPVGRHAPRVPQHCVDVERRVV